MINSFFCCQGCPSGWVRYEKSCYFIDDTPTQKYNDARKTCQSKGTVLAIIRSAQEDKFLFSLVISQITVSEFGAWIGLQRNVTYHSTPGKWNDNCCEIPIDKVPNNTSFPVILCQKPSYVARP